MSLVVLSSKPSQEGVSGFCGSFWTFLVHHSVFQFIVKVLNIHFTNQSATLWVSQMLIPSTRCPYSIKTQGLLPFLHYLLFRQCSALPLFHTDKNSDDIIQKSTLTALVCQGCCSEVGWHKCWVTQMTDIYIYDLGVSSIGLLWDFSLLLPWAWLLGAWFPIPYHCSVQVAQHLGTGTYSLTGVWRVMSKHREWIYPSHPYAGWVI